MRTVKPMHKTRKSPGSPAGKSQAAVHLGRKGGEARAVVRNLLQNAFTFTRPSTTVTLRVGASAERVIIEILDECDGLPNEKVHDLFRPFQELPSDVTGAGLGLAFSRWGVEANDGRISARNLPEKGCVFTVDLPRIPALV